MKKYSPSKTIKMLKAVLYGDTKNIETHGIRFINVLYSGEDGDEIEEVAKKNLERCLKTKNVVIHIIIKNLQEKSDEVKIKTKAHHQWASNNTFKRVVVGEDAPYSGAHLLGNGKEDRKGPYYNALKKYAGKIKGQTLTEQLQNAETLFIDILTVPLPIDSELRKQWSWKFKIGKQSLSSVLFKLALEHYQITAGECVNRKIALMMPPNTAAGIIRDAFKGLIFPDSNDCKKMINEQLKAVNNSEKVTQCLEKEIIPSTFSVLAMNLSNQPNGFILSIILK